MGCQRATGGRRVRLTDQGLVAVRVAQAHAAAAGRAATGADVLVGLGAEPDGEAGVLLRRRAAALAALAERSTAPPPGLAPLEVVVAAAADRAGPRPPGTADLLAAALTVGGDDLEDLLGRCGYDPADLWPDRLPRGPEAWTPAETVTLDDPEGPRLAPPAVRAVARARAADGGAVALLVALVDDAAGEAAALVGAVDADDLAAAAAALAPEGADVAEDAGLDAVLHAAGVLAGEGPVGTAELVQAALVAGGRRPLAVLEAARRRSRDDRSPP